MIVQEKATIDEIEELLRYFMKVFGEQDWADEFLTPLLLQYHEHLLRRIEGTL